MSESANVVDVQPQMQKPMLAHLRDGSPEQAEVTEKQVGVEHLESSYYTR